MSKAVKRRLIIAGVALLHLLTTVYLSLSMLGFILRRHHYGLSASEAHQENLVQTASQIMEFPVMPLSRFIFGSAADGSTVALTASKLSFVWKGLVLISQHLVVKQCENPTVEEMKQLFEVGFQFARKNNRVPLPRGIQFGYMIVPCIVTERVQTSLAPLPPIAEARDSSQNLESLSLMQYVANPPKSHFSIIELPVLYDLASSKAHYFRANATWGSWMYPIAQKIAGKYVDV